MERVDHVGLRMAVYPNDESLAVVLRVCSGGLPARRAPAGLNMFCNAPRQNRVCLPSAVRW